MINQNLCSPQYVKMCVQMTTFFKRLFRESIKTFFPNQYTVLFISIKYLVHENVLYEPQLIVLHITSLDNSLLLKGSQWVLIKWSRQDSVPVVIVCKTKNTFSSCGKTGCLLIIEPSDSARAHLYWAPQRRGCDRDNKAVAGQSYQEMPEGPFCLVSFIKLCLQETKCSITVKVKCDLRPVKIYMGEA